MVPTGGPHLEVRQGERWRGEAGWACWVGWDVGPSGKKKKKMERRWWAGLGWKGKESLFILFFQTQTPFEQISFEFKQV